jgi:hypothetical protein
MSAAPSAQRLADVLKAAGLTELALRAEQNEFHDFLSPHELPDLLLSDELLRIAMDDKRPDRERMAAHHIRMRHHDGEFDATKEESDEWAESEDGRAAFAMLVRSNRKGHS